VTRLDPILLTCLLHTESRFKKDAASDKGYRGEAQTRRFSEYSSVNILEGAETLRDKLSKSNGNMFEALARYKGGKDKKEAREEAEQVLKLYQSQLERRGLWTQ
jgi:soluble lytic murein transglycosylase-like protein